MNRFDFYMTYDHRARGRNMWVSVAIAAVSGGLAQSLFDASLSEAALVCALTAAILEIAGALLYSIPDSNRRRAIIFAPIRRQLLTEGFAAATLIIFALLRVPRLEGLDFEHKIDRASDDPANPEIAQNVRSILASAKAVNIEISPVTLQRAGKRFVNAAADYPGSWDAAVALVDYRSFLNQSVAPRPATKPAPFRIALTFRAPRGTPLETFANTLFVSLRSVPENEAARIEPLSGLSWANRHPGDVGPAHIILEGTPSIVCVLDNMLFKNVIIRDAVLAYDGGPISMEYVFFVNCTFQISPTPRGASLADAVLNSAPVFFHVSSS